MAFCTNCGAKLADNAKFCTECGAKVERVPSEPAVTPTAPVSDPTGKRLYIFCPGERLYVHPNVAGIRRLVRFVFAEQPYV